METTPEVLVAEGRSPWPEREQLLDWCARVRSPVMVLHGSDDHITPHARGEALSDATGGRLVTLEGSGHNPAARDPVRVNLLLREFAGNLGFPPSRRLKSNLEHYRVKRTTNGSGKFAKSSRLDARFSLTLIKFPRYQESALTRRQGRLKLS